MLDTTRPRLAPRLGAALLLGLLACGTPAPETRFENQGMLPARWTDPQGRTQEVPFSYEAQNRQMGAMFTTLGRGGERFEGHYLFLEASTAGALVTEVYDGWTGPEWEIWKEKPDGDWIATATSFGEFADFYTGKVVASLDGDHGHGMRCRLTVRDPRGSLLQGGRGACQISDGGRIEIEF